MSPVRTGLERLLADPPLWLKGLRLGLLCNPASVDHRLQHARHLIHERFPGALRVLFSPQHGFFAEKQDNMIESGDVIDPDLSLPVFSLYGQTRVPTREMFADIDLLLIDLQDAGSRVYTFIYTLSYCMETAGDCGKKVLVLDRPNPVGGTAVEGNLLDPDWASFVGRFPIPMRHGLTIGELARLFNARFGVGDELEVIPMAGWQREMFFASTRLPWVAPSPNLPTPASALVYPGQVLWEGTNVSEGRGTTQPFELFGAPFFNVAKVAAEISTDSRRGAILRPAAFEPTSNKWQGRCCRGFQIHVTEPSRFAPYTLTLNLLQAVLKHHPGQFAWRPPPYEYEYDKPPIDLLIGDRAIRQRLEALEPAESIEASWQAELDEFRKMSREYHLYP
ncbi:MAG: exo-beta-N-acetylmuramidase NamZ domain-containing protein [Hyphomicrobiales bacterium]